MNPKRMRRALRAAAARRNPYPRPCSKHSTDNPKTWPLSTEFSLAHGNEDGLASICKKCRRAESKALRVRRKLRDQYRAARNPEDEHRDEVPGLRCWAKPGLPLATPAQQRDFARAMRSRRHVLPEEQVLALLGFPDRETLNHLRYRQRQAGDLRPSWLWFPSPAMSIRTRGGRKNYWHRDQVAWFLNHLADMKDAVRSHYDPSRWTAEQWHEFRRRIRKGLPYATTPEEREKYAGESVARARATQASLGVVRRTRTPDLIFDRRLGRMRSRKIKKGTLKSAARYKELLATVDRTRRVVDPRRIGGGVAKVEEKPERKEENDHAP